MRVRRSELTTPGSNRDMMEKAAASEADEVMLDLEDAVAPDEKKEARKKIVDAINGFDWTGTVVAVRINGLDTRYAYGDLIEVVEGAGEGLDAIIVPKIKDADDVNWVDTFLDQLEENLGIETPIDLEVLIEETEAVQNVDAIAASSSRLESLIFGPGDYAASQGINLEIIGADDRPDPADVWLYPRNRIVVAARSNGLDAIDGPFADFSDPEGYRQACEWSKALGFVGKWAIHPSQIKIANDVYAPAESAVDQAQRVVEAMEKGTEEGQGAVQLQGEMLDEASVRKARRTLERARTIGMID